MEPNGALIENNRTFIYCLLAMKLVIIETDISTERCGASASAMILTVQLAVGYWLGRKAHQYVVDPMSVGTGAFAQSL